MVKSLSKYQTRRDKPDIPDNLIRDVIDGQIFYYNGYRDVLNKTKTIEEIMGCSTLRSYIFMYVQYMLTSKLGMDKFHFFSNETGLHISKKVNFGLDLAVFDVAALPCENINEHYADVPPVLVVEVDIKVDTKNLTDEEYICLKTHSLLENGAGKVVWVSSKNKKVLIAEKDKKWIEQSWYEEFELMEGIIANVGEYLRQKGVPAAQ